MTKQCCTCKMELNSDSFYKDSSRVDGLERRCKPCVSLKNKKKNKGLRSIFKCEVVDKKERKRLYDQQYKLKNKDRLRTSNRVYAKKHRKESINARLAHNIRTRVKRFVKKGSVSKNIGCTWEELRKHLESKFLPGMTWDNYGLDGWHIDHILPLSKFNLENPEEFKKACNYNNLQPLWASDNIKKSNKL